MIMFPSPISEPIKILNLALPAAAVLYSSFRAWIKLFADSSGDALGTLNFGWIQNIEIKAYNNDLYLFSQNTNKNSSSNYKLLLSGLQENTNTKSEPSETYWLKIIICFYFYILNSTKIKGTDKHPLKSQKTALFRRGKKNTGLQPLAVQGSVFLWVFMGSEIVLGNIR